MRPWLVQLVWKEYREQRAFWLAMLCLAVAVQTALRFWPPAAANRSTWLIWAALAVPALYAAGSGATLFSVEHERRTFGFLQTLPIGAWPLAAGKILWSAASVLAMQIALWCVAAALDGGSMPRPADHRPELGLFGLAALEALAWGIACSLLLREPLVSAVAAIFFATLAIHVAATWIVDRRTAYGFETEIYVTAIPYRLLFLALVVALDGWLVPRWLAERLPRVRLSWRRRTPAGSRRAGAVSMFRAARQLGHLAWQTWREARPVIWLLVAIGLALTSLYLFWDAHPFPNQQLMVVAMVAIVAALAGTFVFRADQRRDNRRFLAQRGVSPALVWLSRQSVWIVIVTVWASAVLLLPLAGFLQELGRNGDGQLRQLSYWQTLDYQQFGYWPVQLSPHAVYWIAWLAALLSCIPLAYASGQLTSMFVRSGLIAAVIAVVLAALVSAWALLMQALEISSWWSVAPLLVALLAATRLRAKDWLIERRGVRWWAAPVGVLLLPVLALAVAVPAYRIHEIPLVRPVWPADSEPGGDATAGRETLELYLQAWDIAAAPWSRYVSDRAEVETKDQSIPFEPNRFDPPPPPRPDQLKLVGECRGGLELALAASRRERCDFAMLPGDPYPNAGASVQQLGYLLLMAGNVYTAEGQLDEAWQAYWGVLRISRHLMMGDWPTHDAQRLAGAVFDRLPYWAAHDGQTPARIRESIAELQNFERTLTSAAAVLRGDYRRSLAAIDNFEEAARWLYPDTTIPARAWIESRLPWERERARRLLDYTTEQDLGLLERIEQRLADSTEVATLLPQRFLSAPPRDAQFSSWLRTTALYYNGRVDEQIAWDRVSGVDRYRVALTLLALEGWKLEQGSLPDRLNRLVGSFLRKLPVDPLAGAAYVYFRAGWPCAVELGERGHLPSSRPFVWSLRPENWWLLPLVRSVRESRSSAATSSSGELDVSYCILDEYGHSRTLSLGEALRYGQPYLVP